MAKIELIEEPLSSAPSRDTKVIHRHHGIASYTIFCRTMPEGLFLVHSYIEDGFSHVEGVVDGVAWSLYYNHTPVSTRQAGLLVNRFLADVEEVKK